MLQSQWVELTAALVCATLASLLVAIETTLTELFQGRVEKLVESRARGAERIQLIVQDPVPFVNAATFTRMSFEAMAMTLVTLVIFQNIEDMASRLMTLVAILLVVLFMLQGVAPRMIGRQYPERVIRSFVPPVSLLTTVLGPVAQLMVLLGSALTSGRGLSDGLFASEVKLRDLVDTAETNEVIETYESKMIHSVFKLGDTLVREVMVPRTDMVWVPRDHALRQLLSLALRSDFSRIPVAGDSGIDDVLDIVYLKGVTGHVYNYPDAEHSGTVGDLMCPANFVPDSEPASELLRSIWL